MWDAFKAIYLRAPMPVKEKKNVVVMPEAQADSVEGAFQIAGNPLTSFSEEDLVQCAGSSGNQGCNGGLMDDAFQWIEKNGIATEASYPYTSGTGTTGTCKSSVTAAAKVSGFQDVAQGSESG